MFGEHESRGLVQYCGNSRQSLRPTTGDTYFISDSLTAGLGLTNHSQLSIASTLQGAFFQLLLITHKCIGNMLGQLKMWSWKHINIGIIMRPLAVCIIIYTVVLSERESFAILQRKVKQLSLIINLLYQKGLSIFICVYKIKSVSWEVEIICFCDTGSTASGEWELKRQLER